MTTGITTVITTMMTAVITAVVTVNTMITLIIIVAFVVDGRRVMVGLSVHRNADNTVVIGRRMPANVTISTTTCAVLLGLGATSTTSRHRKRIGPRVLST